MFPTIRMGTEMFIELGMITRGRNLPQESHSSLGKSILPSVTDTHSLFTHWKSGVGAESQLHKQSTVGAAEEKQTAKYFRSWCWRREHLRYAMEVLWFGRVAMDLLLLVEG